VVLALRALEQGEFDEALEFVEIGLAGAPDRLEIGLGALDDLEAVHGDIHGKSSFWLVPRTGWHQYRL